MYLFRKKKLCDFIINNIGFHTLNRRHEIKFGKFWHLKLNKMSYKMLIWKYIYLKTNV